MNVSDDFPMTMELEAGMNAQYVPPVLVAFGLYPMLNQEKSRAAGSDVFEEVEHVKIAIPGDKTSLFFQPSTEKHRQRFPQAYAAFKNRAQTPAEGTPIEHWAAIGRAIALTLRAAHIPTIEAFAAVHEGNIDRLGISNARELQAKAKAFLAQKVDGAATAKLAAEKQELADRLKAMEAQLLELSKIKADETPTTAPAADPAMAARRPRQRAGASS